MRFRSRTGLPDAIAITLVVALSAPCAAWAGPSETAPSDGATDRSDGDDPRLRAKSLYEQGKNRFDTADYDAAIELWTEAYGALPNTPDAAPIKAALIYNIATAQERAYAIDKDITHLRRAAILVQQYADAIPALYGEGEQAQAERDRVQERLEDLRTRIEEAEAAQPEPEAEPDAEDESIEHPFPEPVPSSDMQPDPRTRPLIISGAVLAGLGVAMSGVMAGGLVMGSQANDGVPEDLEQRRDQFDKGRTGNTLAIASGVVAGVLVVTGATLLGVGLSRRRSPVAVTPSVGPKWSGLSLSGRF